MARHAGALIVRPNVIDGLDQAGVVDGEGVSRKQPWRVETQESGTLVGRHPGEKAVSVELELIVFVMPDDRGAAVRARQQHAGAAGERGSGLIAAAEKISAAVPHPDILKIHARSVGNAVHLAHEFGKSIARRRLQRAQPAQGVSALLELAVPADPGHDVTQRRFGGAAQC